MVKIPEASVVLGWDVRYDEDFTGLLCIIVLAPFSRLTVFLQIQEFSFRNLPVATDQFHYRRAAFSSQIKSKVGNILVQATTLQITLNIDGDPTMIVSKSHTHPSHSQTSRLLTSTKS